MVLVAVLKSKSVTVFSQSQLVSEIQASCAPRQRALLSLLVISQKHKLPPAQLVASFADDLPRTPLETRRKTRKFYWSRVHDFSEELQQAQSMPDSLEKFPGLLPGEVELALRLEREQGTFDKFTDAWLNRPPDYVYEATRSQSSVNSMFTLFFKAFVILNLANFIVIKVFTEFQAMMEEFAVEPPPIFDFTAKIFDALVKLWFIPFLLFLIAILFYIPAVSRYFKRWNPFVWRQPSLPRSVSTRQVLALVTAHGKSISANALSNFWKRKRSNPRRDAGIESTTDKAFDWNQLASRRFISKSEAMALQTTDSHATQAWLLQKSAITRNERIESRRMSYTRWVVTIVNVILTGLVLLFAISIFATLISIMSQLQ